MQELTRGGEKLMTVQEVSSVLGVTDEAIKWHIRKMWPEKMGNGRSTFLNEEEVYEIKQKMKPTSQLVGATTDYEMYQKMHEVQDWLAFKIKQLEEERDKAKAKIAILTHVNKTYTATEIAKELGMQSAQQLNLWLHERGVQFLQNKTWVPYSAYSSLGYFDIKQQVLDNGIVVYDRKITQTGREFILELHKENK